jgi:hypothetical protein
MNEVITNENIHNKTSSKEDKLMKAEIDCEKTLRIIKPGGDYEPYFLVVGTPNPDNPYTPRTQTTAAHGIEDLMEKVREIMA